jgi:hypothetical protein
MSPLLLGGLFDLAGKVFDKIFPNPQQAAEAKLKLFEMQQAGELKVLEAETQLAMGQLKVNEVEAGSDSLFKSGWRPAVGWTCVMGLLYQFVVLPFATFFLAWYKVEATLPVLNLDTLMTLLFGLLGLGAYRTAEKIKGVTK